MSLEERLQVAKNAREASKQHVSLADMKIMDVNDEAVANAFRRSGTRRMIHGHTHRPAFHDHEVDGQTCQRIVLADWYQSGSVLLVTPEDEVMEPLN